MDYRLPLAGYAIAAGAHLALLALMVASTRGQRAGGLLPAALAVQEGVQMHGGIGMTDEFEMGFFMKRARVLHELFGDATYHADLLAQLKKY